MSNSSIYGLSFHRIPLKSRQDFPGDFSDGFQNVVTGHTFKESSPDCLSRTASFVTSVLKATTPGHIYSIYGHIAAHLPETDT